MNVDHRPIAVTIGRRPGQAEVGQSAPRPGPSSNDFRSPAVDIHEGPDGLVLEADLPGVSSENLTIQVEDNILTLRGVVDAPELSGARVILEEFRATDFHRSFILSDEVERSKIAAELKDGVLRLTLPKADRVKTRRIEIQSS